MSEADAGLQDTPEPAGLDAIISGAIETSGYGDDKPAVEQSAEPTPDQGDGRARDASGRFVPKESAEPAPSVVEPAKVEAPTAEAIQTPEPAPVVQPVEAPARWTEAEKAEFAKWPPEAQRAVLERHRAMEADYTRKTQEAAETRKSIEPVIGEVQRLNPLLQQMGMTPQQFIAESGAVAHNLLSGNPTDRANAIAYLVQHRQVPMPELLNALGIPLPHAGEGEQPNPAFTQLHQQVTTLQQQLRQMGEQSAQQERQRAQAEFDALGQAKDESGQLKFPHFGRVSQTMIQLVASGQVQTWDDAYVKSVRLDDDLYKQTVDTERQRVAADAEKQRLEAVEKARKAQPVKSSDGSPKGAAQMKGLDAHLSAALDRAGIA